MVGGEADEVVVVADQQHHGAGSPGTAVLTRTLVEPFAADPVRADVLRTEYYRFVVDVTIEGLRRRVVRSPGWSSAAASR